MVRRLLEHGADVNGKGDRGNTPLHGAIEKGSEEMVELLLTHKPQLELKNLQDLTPLQLAINIGQVKPAQQLLTARANPNVRFEAKGTIPIQKPSSRPGYPPDQLPGDGKTPLHWAVQWGFKPAVEGLLNAKADVNAKDDYGNTPLHLTVGQKSKEILELLLARTADVNARDKTGNTPLHRAVDRRDKQAVELLLAKGADLTAKNDLNQTPLDLARPPTGARAVEFPPRPFVVSGSPDSAPPASSSEIAELLKKHGAKE